MARSSIDVDDLASAIDTKLKIRGSNNSAPAHFALPQEKLEYKDQVKAETDGESCETFSGDLDDFRKWRGYEPSKMDLVKDKVHSFAVKNPHYDHKKRRDERVSLDDYKALGKEFLAMPKYKVGVNSVKNLAKKYDLKSGKWMSYFSFPENSDRAWQNLVKSLLDGSLIGLDGVVEIAITVFDPRDSNPHTKGGNYGPRIKIVTDDYTDEQETMKIGRGALKVFGAPILGGTIKYKPDIYSELKIFAHNPYKLRPTIYFLPA